MESSGRSVFVGAATVLTAAGASLCCILPVATASLGLGSAALGSWMGPYRPWLLGLTFTFLALGFYQVYRPLKCAPGEACGAWARRRRQRVVLWFFAGMSILLMAFPYYMSWFV